MESKRNRTLRIAFTGIMCALNIVITWVLPIPMPASKGYINFGDSIIFLTGLFAGVTPAVIVGGIGSMLADILGGFAHWAPFTLVIKGIEGLIVGLFMRKIKDNKFHIIELIGMLLSALWMMAGYYFAGAIMYGWAGALASLAGNAIQAFASVGIAFVLYILLIRIKEVRAMQEKLLNNKKNSTEKEQIN